MERLEHFFEANGITGADNVAKKLTLDVFVCDRPRILQTAKEPSVPRETEREDV